MCCISKQIAETGSTSKVLIMTDVSRAQRAAFARGSFLLLLAVSCHAFAFNPAAPHAIFQGRHPVLRARSSRPAASLKLRMVSQEMVQGVVDASQAGLHLAFADQGSNLAGKFFQASLLPYLAFLYFLNNNGAKTPKLSGFGFGFLLLFVIATIPTGIISKTVYGVSLADVDWLHGSAEALLTVTNILIAVGFRDAMSSGTAEGERGTLKIVAIAIAALVAGAAAIGSPVLGFEAHTPFLAGLGDLPSNFFASMGAASEPANALSIPTWAIHFSSVFEWIFAMRLVWDYADASKDQTWKGLTWGMLPLHASGVAACTYHFFYNNPDLSFLVALQAGLTCLGNFTVAIAAARIALANGWKVPFFSSTEAASQQGDEKKQFLESKPPQESDTMLIAKLAGLTVTSAYLVKYGELFLSLPFQANAVAAIAMVATPPALLASFYLQKAAAAQEAA
uniref:Uncharacterized protein n=1 Tax=Guillardia theta TaxID=55529 RepID=A0A7S4NP79_GUITH